MPPPPKKTPYKRSHDSLSVVALFDDICRRNKVLSKSSDVFKSLSGDLLNTLDKCFHDVQEFQKQTAELQNSYNHIKALHDHTNQLYLEETKRRQAVEAANQRLEDQIEIIRQVLLEDNTLANTETKEKLAFLKNRQRSRGNNRDHSAGSLLDVRELSFDSEDNFGLNGTNSRIGSLQSQIKVEPGATAKGGRYIAKPFRSNTGMEDEYSTTPLAKPCCSNDLEPSAPQDSSPSQSSRKRRSEDSQDSFFGIPMKRLASDDLSERENNLIAQQRNTNRAISPDQIEQKDEVVATPQPSRLKRAHCWTKSKPLLLHEFCTVCGRRMKFAKTALKCNGCGMAAHPECRDKVISTCLLSATTPKSAVTPSAPDQSQKSSLGDFCPPNEVPHIPALVIHCITEIENRGLKEQGIYRISGSDRQVKDLLNKFHRGKTTPVLSAIDDIHVICCCLKLFFRQLDEPLVTYAKWPDFLAATQLVDKDASISKACELIEALPHENRDTLCYLILHLQKVMHSSACSMGHDNLCKVFGPTIVGNSVPDPEYLQTINETKDQQAIFSLFLTVPRAFYEDVMQTSESSGKYFPPVTPLASKSGYLKTPGSVTRSGKRRFFESPRR